jgi:predicted enzyme related to lactoylglutathione lyase
MLVEFPADDPDRALRFWEGVLGRPLAPRTAAQGEGWQTDGDGGAVGIHPRAAGPGDRVSLPYFHVDDVDAAVARVEELGGRVVHRGERWSICRDSEGSPFGLGPLA